MSFVVSRRRLRMLAPFRMERDGTRARKHDGHVNPGRGKYYTVSNGIPLPLYSVSLDSSSLIGRNGG